MTFPLDRASITLVLELAIWALRSLVLAGVAGVGLAAFRPRTTALRLFVWTSVLYASIALPAVNWIVPALRVPMPNFLQPRTARIEHADIQNSANAVPEQKTVTSSPRSLKAPTGTPAALVSNSVPTGLHANRSLAGSRSVFLSFRWQELVAATYLVVAIFFLIRFAAGIVFTHKLVRNAQPITDPGATAKLGFHANAPPRLATSGCISVPLTVGVLRPTILLPANWDTWEEAKLHAVVAHELSHVARRDTLTQTVALLYRAIFWFNPLAWWLSVHLADLAEQASDESALSGGTDRTYYARTLLGFFENLQTAPGRVRWQGVSMARAGQAEQRVERILAWKGTVAMNLKKSLAVAILVLAVPVVYLAAAIRPVSAAPPATPASRAQSAPPAPAGAPVDGVTTPAPAGVPPVGGVTAPAAISGVPSVGPVTAVAPAAPVAAVAPTSGVSQSSTSGTSKGFSYHYGYDDEERFVIVSGKSDSFTMSGSVMDARHAEKLKKQIPGDFIWFQREEKSYIIQDQATIDRARALWAPQEELGKKQEALGKQQEELGKQQEELGSKMEQVRVNVPDMTAELDRLRAKLQKLGPTATVGQIGEIQSEIGELQSKMGEIQSRAGEQQGKFGALQGELGEKQGRLGEQQGELGRQQAELAEKATREMKQLLDEALKNGKAQPEKQSGDGSML